LRLGTAGRIELQRTQHRIFADYVRAGIAAGNASVVIDKVVPLRTQITAAIILRPIECRVSRDNRVGDSRTTTQGEEASAFTLVTDCRIVGDRHVVENQGAYAIYSAAEWLSTGGLISANGAVGERGLAARDLYSPTVSTNRRISTDCTVSDVVGPSTDC
jgi:hypothetical protein